jgi:hypothetical protein
MELLRDDALGGPAAADCRGLATRLAALGARLEIVSVPGARDRGPDGAGVRATLADDGVLVREGLARILTDSGLEVVGQAGDGPSLVDLVRRDPPDVAVIDLRKPPGFGSEGSDVAARTPSTGSPDANARYSP